MNEIIKEHKEYKEQILIMTKIELKKNYKGSFLGPLWLVIKPIITIFVYWFTFAIGLRVSKEIFGAPYFLWLIAGIVPWFYMQEMLTQGIQCLRKYDYLVTKMKFPISIIPTFVSISKITVHLLLMVILIATFWLSGYPIDIYIIQLPIYIMLSYVFFTVLTFLLSILSAISKDILNFVKSIVFAIFWLSGILWDIDNIGNFILAKIVKLNPVNFLIDGYRKCFIKKEWFFEEPITLIIFIAILIIITIITVRCYKKNIKNLADMI